ncbi:lysozyme inhibitor LprI family protein [Maritalea porphyrae]|jgi:uncharacterized protein YecT (DUF1311 family)|uniref:lysozyme inhibitor LprI family protein n=1 Tax=Maritalea porphyrae TaxID=880732 RepID=UPI0022AFACC6|nr:lysozyme inhibitor LprI family protein [Maritalea porphyrae]MCZ4273850.1 lysozyme inhibitor LprI family protein [Maritalea porphyrae]
MFRNVCAALVGFVILVLGSASPSVAVNCDASKTTSEMQVCQTAAKVSAIEKIRAAYQNALVGLSEDDQTLLFETQTAWDTFRDKECVRLSKIVSEGTMRSLAELSCIIKMTTERADVLNTNPLTGEIVEPAVVQEKSSLDVTSPAREILDLANAHLSGQSSESYFSNDRIDRLYSAGFVEKYKKAAASMAAKGYSVVFDYDVIIQAQDGCPLENLSLKTFPKSGQTTIVMATFQSKACWDNSEQNQAYSEVRFEILEQNGRAVINDIYVVVEGGAYMSVQEEMEKF